MTTGLISNLQQFSTEDGPGIRTTVFMKGCPLHCAWCHNPEGMSPQPNLVWYDVRCIGAKRCVDECSAGALAFTADGVQIDRQACTLCGRCTQACPAGAFDVIGKTWGTGDLMTRLVRDRVFFETSGGGITFSGGEPMQQVDFLAEVLPLIKAEGLHIALDTCGAVAWDRYERVLNWVDLLLLDLKIMDPEAHRAATGVSNELILENARRFQKAGKRMWIRTPVVPGYTDGLSGIEAIGNFVRCNLPNVERWDLLAYTNLGKPKYHRLGMEYALENVPLPTHEEMESVWQVGVGLVPVARWSGATR